MSRNGAQKGGAGVCKNSSSVIDVKIEMDRPNLDQIEYGIDERIAEQSMSG